MKSRSPFPLTLTLISAILVASIQAGFAQRQPSANEIYIDKNCQRNQQLPQLERFTIFSRNEFTTNGQNYLFYAARYLDGAVLFCTSKPNFNQPKPLTAKQIQSQFIDKIVRDINNKTAFIIVVQEGNGLDVPMTNYGLELSNVDRPKLTSLSILQQRGTLKDGGPSEHTFQGRAGQSITIDIKSRAFDHNITLFDTSGKNIAEKTGNSQNRRESQLTVKLPSNGTYKIVVKGGDRTSKGNYTLSVNSNQL
ncbi:MULTISPECIES: PPC domain-containing protein [unclassified Microcoleus]|uniref:PPC domain-containing protein n=1 Tax=unclassified Microcoleus TaxID=2642155 RepID=UPI002FD67791